jgi:hypothetical protein
MALFRNSSNKSIKNAKKQVRFNDEPQVLGESADLPKDCFYTSQELGSLKRQAKFAARRHSKGQATPDDWDSRGLEGYFVQGGYEVVQKCIKEHMDSVVQFYRDVLDLKQGEVADKEETLRLFSASLSKGNRANASRIAEQDAKDADAIYQADGIKLVHYVAAVATSSDKGVESKYISVKASLMKSLMKPFKSNAFKAAKSSTARGA